MTPKVLHAGNDPHRTAAPLAALHIDPKHPFEPPRPAHPGRVGPSSAMGGCGWEKAFALTLTRYELCSEPMIRGEHAVTNRQDSRFARPQAARRVRAMDGSHAIASG